MRLIAVVFEAQAGAWLKQSRVPSEFSIFYLLFIFLVVVPFLVVVLEAAASGGIASWLYQQFL